MRPRRQNMSSGPQKLRNKTLELETNTPGEDLRTWGKDSYVLLVMSSPTYK